MSLVDLLLGRPLATEEEKAERIGPGKGVPIFGLDALSSAAYGPEAALTLLIPLGLSGVAYIVPISISIIILLAIVYFSYRQTIMAYPQGGGSYTVASENLGVWAGLLAAASLMVDYVLTAAVGISAGVGALVSAMPSLQKHTLALRLVILIVVTLVNLRGVSETGGIFLVPTYLFIFCLLAMIALGVIKTLTAGGHPVPMVAPPRLGGVAATPPGEPGYQSVLSQLLAAITGNGIFYGLSIGSILVVLALSANTAFADFPRLSRAIAQNGFLPDGLAIRGRRLVYIQGVYALALLAGTLLTVFDGVTDRLIPLYAVGAFMAFTLSQAGMVMHWKRVRGPGSSKSMFVNGLGAVATGLTVIIVLIAKFTEGAWITLLLIPGLILIMVVVKRHYNLVVDEIDNDAPVNVQDLTPPLVVITVDRWSRISNKALRFAMSISPDILALHVDYGEESDTLASQWDGLMEPARRAGLTGPRLVVLKSPYRFVIRPILDYVLDLEESNPRRQIAVLIPELVERRWHLKLLHNHRSSVLRALLLFQGDKRITVINIPWYLTD